MLQISVCPAMMIMLETGMSVIPLKKMRMRHLLSYQIACAKTSMGLAIGTGRASATPLAAKPFPGGRQAFLASSNI